MELAFISRELRDSCQNITIATLNYGELVAKHLLARLSDLRAADTLADLPSTLFEISPDHFGEITVRLTEKYNMALSVNHSKKPTDPHGALVLNRIYRLKINTIGVA